MLILLPPSETKRPGGTGAPLQLGELTLPELAPRREAVVAALTALSDDPERAMKTLKLGERQRGEVAVNATLRRAPTLPAVDRYTGVLYDALDAASLDERARSWLGAHVLIHSAPFGPVGALDPIPAYRLAAGTSLPPLGSLRRHWAVDVTAAIARREPDFVLDLRSEAYVALGSVPPDVPSAYVRVVAVGPDGAVRALNHFNKHGKGDLVRTLALGRPSATSPDAVLAWLRDSGVKVAEAAAGEWHLVTEPAVRVAD